MARKKPLMDKLTDMLLYISDKYELEKTDPALHREIQDLLNQAAEDTTRYWDDVEPDWGDGNGY